MKHVLFIGGHGMLGRPVVRRLVKEGFTVRAMARDPAKATALLPKEVEVVKGDLKDKSSVTRAAEGMETVFLNLATDNPKAKFRPELDGTRNAIAALEDRPELLIAKISALGAKQTSGKWLTSDQKAESDEILRNSGHPCLVFKPTWYMESLPLFISGSKYLRMIRHTPPLYWIAGDDYGKTVAAALRNENFRNRDVPVQGPEAVTFEDAVTRFIRAYNPNLKQKNVPLWMLSVAGWFKPEVKEFVQLLSYTMAYPEDFLSEDVWNTLGKPEMTIEDYVEYMKQTGDVPQKGM